MAEFDPLLSYITGRQAHHLQVPGTTSAAGLSVVSFTAAEAMGEPTTVTIEATHPETLPRADYLNLDAVFTITVEWAWLDTDFDGFQPPQCLLQEAKGNYDQFLNEQDMPEFPFQGFKNMADTIQKQGRLVQENPPAKLMWYFETPKTMALMMTALRSANVPSVYQP
ncbi:Tox-REase-5 domain-containing protein [Paraburkholderia bannensis]|uniref:Tox-REase-5 domain-containing protein n=1 Tax=Paraburkholderia bannensis TaxID=765414 RepID=UPI002ABDB6E7|nr:Tox-REase-5 domain-containing protein [Paraburkholderia bannensis]